MTRRASCLICRDWAQRDVRSALEAAVRGGASWLPLVGVSGKTWGAAINSHAKGVQKPIYVSVGRVVECSGASWFLVLRSTRPLSCSHRAVLSRRIMPQASALAGDEHRHRQVVQPIPRA